MMQAGPASKEAFLQLEEALVRGDIGRIVDVATAYEEMFRLSPEKVPDEWRVQVKAAWNFVGPGAKRICKTIWLVITRLLKAGQQIGALVTKRRAPTPLFTAYEVRHLREAPSVPGAARGAVGAHSSQGEDF